MPKQKRQKPAKETADLTPLVTDIGRMVVDLCEKLPWKERPEGWKKLRNKLAERR